MKISELKEEIESSSLNGGINAILKFLEQQEPAEGGSIEGLAARVEAIEIEVGMPEVDVVVNEGGGAPVVDPVLDNSQG